MKVGLALSGGGIKSYAQLPIVKEIINRKVEIGSIAGTSMGSAIAALVACGFKYEEIHDLALKIEKELVSKKMFYKPSKKILPFSKEKIHAGYIDGEIIESIVTPILAEKGYANLKDVQIPLAIPATDLKSGKTVVFVSHPQQFKANPNWEIITDASLATAIRASCSFPFVIAACEIGEYLLVDGGVKMNLPLPLTNAYGMKKNIVITMHDGEGFTGYRSFVSLGNRIMDLMFTSIEDVIISDNDVQFNVAINDTWIFEFGKGEEIIRAGQELIAKEGYKLEIFKRKGFLRKIISK